MALALALGACGGASGGDKSASPTSSGPSGSAEPTAGAADAGTPQEGGELVWGIETAITTVNPHRNGQDKAVPVLASAFSTYLYVNGAGEFEPWLAESFEQSADGLTFTLHLRDDVTFSDGAPLDAAAVVLNLDKQKDPGYLSNPPAALNSVDSYKAVDTKTVEFTLNKEDIQFPLYLAAVQSSPLSPATFELSQDKLEAGGPELSGIGPFVIDSFTANTELALSKRADYVWTPPSLAGGQTTAYLDKVTFRTLTEGSSRTGALQQGQLDIASDIQPLDVAVFENDPAFTYERSFVGGTPYAYYLNAGKEPFDDVNVRNAFILGADYQAILNTIYQGTYERAWLPIANVGPFPDASLTEWAKTDIEAANALLDESGWTERDDEGYRVKDGQRLRARVVTAAPFVRESRDQVAIAIGAALKQNIGLEFTYDIEDLGTSTEAMDAGEYEIFDNSYGGTDPVFGIELLYYSSDRSRGFIAYTNADDSKLEGWIDEARFTSDQAARKEIYTKLQNYVTKEQAYVLPVYQTQDTWAAKTTVHNVLVDQSSGRPVGALSVWIEH
jgi:peptide/nickel transport system substrate-binding protein